MGKGRYHAVGVNQVEKRALAAVLDSSQIVVSVDVAKERFFAGISGARWCGFENGEMVASR